MFESENVLQAASLYVPCKFSLSTDTDDVNFKYYPHTFWKYHSPALCWLDEVVFHINTDVFLLGSSYWLVTHNHT
jgi:hypothetical protein